MPEQDEIFRILMKNSDKSFVKRILNPNYYPVLNVDDGMIATHKMAWSEVKTPKGIKYVVFPTILFDGEKLIDYSDKPMKALENVLASGNFIQFNDAKTADWFSKKYKLALESGGSE